MVKQVYVVVFISLFFFLATSVRVVHAANVCLDGTSAAPNVIVAASQPAFDFSTCQMVAVDGAVANAMNAYNDPIDYVGISGFFTFSFSFTILMWLLGRNVGLIIQAIKEF